MWECKQCKNRFNPTGPRSEYCSSECRRKARNSNRPSQRRGGDPDRVCDVCLLSMAVDLRPNRKRHPECDGKGAALRARKAEVLNPEAHARHAAKAIENRKMRAWNERFVRSINNCPHCKDCGEQFDLFSRRRVCDSCLRVKDAAWHAENDKKNRERRNQLARERRDETTLLKEREIRARYPDKIREQQSLRSTRRRALERQVPHEPWSFNEVWSRFGGRCYLCLRECDKDNRFSNVMIGATVDHIHPISKGGPDVIWNLALCCRACNLFKWNKYLAEVDIQYLRSRYE